MCEGQPPPTVLKMGTRAQGPAEPRSEHTRTAFIAVAAFAVLPYFELVAAHPGEVQVARLAVWFVATVMLAVAVVWVARPRGHARRAAVFISLLLYLSFRFPAVADLQHRLGITEDSHVLGWVLLTLLTVMVAVPISRRAPVQLWVAVVGAAFAVIAGMQATMSWSGVTTPAKASEVAVAVAERPATTPNIWLFVPDGYTRSDVLEDRTGLDNSMWLDALRERGFDVAEEARANYPVTWVSLPAMLEMTYLLNENDRLQHLEPLYDRLRGNNTTVETLRSWGYTYVHAFSGAAVWEGAKCVGHEDRCIGESRFTETDWGVLRSTPLGPLLQRSMFRQVAQLANPTHVTDRVFANEPDPPYFVMAHLMSPHAPFVRDRDCRFREGVHEQYIGGRPEEYRGMVECLNQQLLEAIDQILVADPDAIILIQADHGHDWGLNFADPYNEEWTSEVGDDRWPLLAALRLPDTCGVPDDLAPVNTMRLLFACMSGEQPDLLPYRSWIVGYHPDVLVHEP